MTRVLAIVCMTALFTAVGCNPPATTTARAVGAGGGVSVTGSTMAK